jgi:hypothetical protein
MTKGLSKNRAAKGKSKPTTPATPWKKSIVLSGKNTFAAIKKAAQNKGR